MWLAILFGIVVYSSAQPWGEEKEQYKDVRLPPSFIVTPSAKESSTYFKSDATIVLPCIATGVPEPTYQWKRNGGLMRIDDYPNIRSSPDPANGTIKIMSAGTLDEGVYQCVASNKYGIAISDKVQLTRAFLGARSDLPTKIVRATPGEPVSLECRAPRSVPKPSYVWALAIAEGDIYPVAYQTNSRVIIDDNGSLRFAYVKPTDHMNGMIYKCRTANHVTDVMTLSGYTILDVLSNASNSKPRVQVAFSNNPGNGSMVGLVGESLKLRCIFSGKPEPRILWRKENGRPRSSTSIAQHNTELTIDDIRQADEGVYTCEGLNPDDISDAAYHSFHVVVRAKPKFEFKDDMLSDKNVTNGDRVSFHCRASGNPKPLINWTINGQSLGAFENPRFQVSEDGETLTLENACKTCSRARTDLMVVQCNASNEFGYAYSQGYLNVLEKTIITQPPESSIIDSAKGNVIFTCKAESDPSTPPEYTWLYRGERIQHMKGPWEVLETGTLKVRTNFTSIILVQGIIGEYTCIARTPYSEDRASAVLRVLVEREKSFIERMKEKLAESGRRLAELFRQLFG